MPMLAVVLSVLVGPLMPVIGIVVAVILFSRRQNDAGVGALIGSLGGFCIWLYLVASSGPVG